MLIIQPASQDACTGQAVVFDALAESAQPVGYQWFRGGSPFAGQTKCYAEPGWLSGRPTRARIGWWRPMLSAW